MDSSTKQAIDTVIGLLNGLRDQESPADSRPVKGSADYYKTKYSELYARYRRTVEALRACERKYAEKCAECTRLRTDTASKRKAGQQNALRLHSSDATCNGNDCGPAKPEKPVGGGGAGLRGGVAANVGARARPAARGLGSVHPASLFGGKARNDSPVADGGARTPRNARAETAGSRAASAPRLARGEIGGGGDVPSPKSHRSAGAARRSMVWGEDEHGERVGSLSKRIRLSPGVDGAAGPVRRGGSGAGRTAVLGSSQETRLDEGGGGRASASDVEVVPDSDDEGQQEGAAHRASGGRQTTPDRFWDIDYFPPIRTAGPEQLRRGGGASGLSMRGK